MLLLWAYGNDPPEPPGEDPNDCEDRMPQNPAPEPEQLLTPSEVAAMFRVNPKTVTRWARAGKISAIRTLGGHRRFKASEIRKFLEQVDEANEVE
jgi:excisionase family DNA binding protein